MPITVIELYRDVLPKTNCGDCGQPMGIVEHGDELWIECASLRTRRGFWHAFSEAFHERHPLDLPVGEVSLAA